MKYKVRCTYISSKEIEVDVKDGGDPMDPADWEEIQYEHELDCSLDDVQSATPIDDQGRTI